MEKCENTSLWKGEKNPSVERIDEVRRLREEISKKPHWLPRFKETFDPREMKIMTKYYEDLEGIVAASEILFWNKLHTYQYEYKVGTFDETGCSRWDEDWQEPREYPITRRTHEGEVGLVQQAFDAAVSQSQRTGEEIFSCRHDYWEMIPPCNLDIDVHGAGCRLLWGRKFLKIQMACGGYEFDFFMSGREFVVSVKYDLHATFYPEGSGGFEHLSVMLLRGEPLDKPCWGTLVP